MIRFRQFCFDAETAQLRRGREVIPMRPKAALLLEVFLAEPGRIVSKSELTRAVWNHECVEDQALFQLISEIRQALADRSCIATFPNRGYRWNWEIENSDFATRQGGWNLAWKPVAVAASVLLVIGALGAFLPQPSVPEPAATPIAIAGLSPAMSAVTRAMQARASGQLGEAERLLQLAVQANPHFAAAKLELSDVLRIQGNLEGAAGMAHDALSDARIVGDHYLEATAHVLLSQLRLGQGDLAAALQLNAEAARIANDHGHVCAAQMSAAWQQRLTLALTQPQPRSDGNPSVRIASMDQSSWSACEAALVDPQSSHLDLPIRQPLSIAALRVTG